MKVRHEKILVPFDFDENGVAALEHAAGVARESGARLLVLHVVPEDEFHLNRAVYEPEKTGGADPERATEIARGKLAKIVAEHVPAEVSSAFDVRLGKPAEVILAAEKDFGADLVVMFTHGRTGLAHMVLGSVTEKVLRSSSCPVLALRRHELAA